MALSWSTQYLASLATSHEAISGVDVTLADGTAHSAVAIGGQVVVDATSKIRRTLTLKVAPGDPVWESAVLAGAVLRPWRGIRYVDGATEKFQLGVFELRGSDTDLSGLTEVTLTAPDRWRYVQRARFYTPMASVAGAKIPAEFARIVRAALPVADRDGMVFHDLSGSTQVLAPTVWPRDRDAAADDLAASIGCEGFFDTNGDLVLRRITDETALPIWTVDASNVLFGGTRARSDERSYSAVVVTPTRTDGTTPFDTQVVEDRNPLSQTYVGGRFGQVARFYSSPAITTNAQAKDAAAQLLRKVAGVQTTLTLSTVVNPALDAGDVIQLLLPGPVRQQHVLDTFTVPLDVESPMPVQTRTHLASLDDEPS